MCNLYSMNRSQDEIRGIVGAMRDETGNMPPLPGIFPDYLAPIVRTGEDGQREIVKLRWGMPSPQNVMFEAAELRANKLRAKGKEVDFKELLRLEPDSGVTNIRNTKSKHWRTWLEEQHHRCVVPFTSFCEFNRAAGGNIWFALDESRPLAFFAGLWTRWTSVRKIKEGEITAEFFGFLTTDANSEVHAIHPKAMPVILRSADAIETWLKAPADEALALQRPLPDGSLTIVAQGEKEDPPPAKAEGLLL
jgi:putative SOS response-associated peptidase YedK